MKTINTRIQKLFAASLGLSAIMLPALVSSAPGTLTSQPLFTQNAVDPNIILSIDDSSSMDFEVLFTTNDGALYWDEANDTFHSLTDGVVTSDDKYVYLFPNGNGFASGKRQNTDDNNHFAIPPFIQYAYTRSPDYNKAYFNPSTTYTPWTSYGSQTFGNIDPTNAPADPHSGRSADTFNLTGNLYYTGTDELFRIQDDMVVPEGTKYKGSATATADDDEADSEESVSVEYKPATYYTVVTSGTYQVKDFSDSNVAGDCALPNPVHYDFFEVTPSGFKALGANPAVSLGPDGGCLEAHTITADTDEMQNFANWFSYYRKRHLALRGGLTAAFDEVTGVRVGIFTINDLSSDGVTMRDFDTEKDTVFSQIYSEEVGGGTPNRQALDYAGQQYQRTNAGAPITDECQKNFTIFFTDGYSSLGGTLPSPGNTDNAAGTYSGVDPYKDDYDNTLADIAMKYYTENLRTDLTPTGQVPVSSQCDVAPLDKQLDCNENLHMVTYTVGLGALGTIFNNTVGMNFYDEVADVYANPVTWPDVTTQKDPRQIDDLYHAAVNGRGEIFSADTPADLSSELKEVLKSITEQTGSAASVAFNTSVLSTGSVVYQARFNTDKWKGELLSFDLNPVNGDVALTASWDAGDNIPAPASRVIYTYNQDTPGATTTKGVLFKPATSDDLSDTSLPALAKLDLNDGLPTVSGLNPELTAKDRLNYLRGDRTYEGPDPTGKSRFRARHEDTVLGDIVHSAPLFVGDAVLNWPTGDGSVVSFPSGINSYETWADSLSRTSVVYVGANDGMLHGFNAANGVEIMAYVPSSLYSDASSEGLHYLSEPDYQHRYYVDNTPSRTDAYVQGRSSTGAATSRDWRSIIVGTLRGGGKGVFALDVTNPATFSDTTGSAASTALWEFNSSDDADLGFTFSRPTIVPTNRNDGSGNIRWAAIFGNGYNNGGDCHAKLFVLFLDGGLDGTWTAGTDYLELDTGMGTAGDCNGLSTPAVVDLNGDGKADGAYAGDLYGNMWNFDLCNKDNQGVCQSTGWDVDYDTGGGSATPAPLFAAADAGGTRQPITATPIVISHPTILSGGLDPNVLVLFGTGQYLVDGDKTDAAPPSHTYYGIWDRGDASLTRAKLMEQIFETGYGKNAPFRITGLDVPKYTDPVSTRQYGWYLDLPDTSDNTASGAPERVVTSSVVIGDIVFFNTLVPTANGCDIGGYGYLMSVETKNGGRPESSIIDVNGDGNIDDSDFQDVAGEDAAVVGKKTNEGILSEPAFLGDKRYESTSKGKILKDDVDPSGLTNTGRFSWQEIRAQ